MFNFDLTSNRPEEVVLKRGETVIIAYWQWKWPIWRSGYRRKAITVDMNGEIEVKHLT